ncbi:MAG: hypothetical protein HZB42_14300 [Sphingobacteriales bacterium]|nr:hypothetical protein [Sphingobacteriales bacterium]
MKKKFLSAAIAFVIFAGAHAQTNVRQDNQENRTENGVQSGELTRREQRRIDHQQENVQKLENKAKKDGVVTDKEQARINAAQNRSSRSIARKKHNGRDSN